MMGHQAASAHGRQGERIGCFRCLNRAMREISLDLQAGKNSLGPKLYLHRI